MSAPIRHTCPDIDRVIKSIKDARKSVEYLIDTEDIKDKNYYASCIDDELYGIIDVLEELRESNSKLRDWGHDLEEELEETQKELQSKENES